MAKGIKTGGRRKGVTNHLTREIRSILKAIIAKELEKLPSVLQNMEDEKRVNLVIKLLPYVLPRIENVHMTQGEPYDSFLEV